MAGGKVKVGSGINRGYIGYHTTWDGIKVFLRSKCEFIYACVLDAEKIPYKMECVRYTINEKTYKPDFFIFDPTYQKILKIVETKGLDDKQIAINYLNMYKEYFNSIGIDYDVVWKYQALIATYNLSNKISQWVEKSIREYDFISDSRGENNPMYGKLHSESTKSLIGEKCKDRNSDPEYKIKCSISQKNFWESPRGILRKKEISDLRKQEALRKNPSVEKQCIFCSKLFIQKLKGHGLCSGLCMRRWNRQNIDGYGKHSSSKSYANQLNTWCNKICTHYNITMADLTSDLDRYIQLAKSDSIIPKNKGISLKTLKKYNLISWQN